MRDLITIGIDPGPTPGICVLGDGPGLVMQCDHKSAFRIVRALTIAYAPIPCRIACERFVIGPISRASKGAGAITRDLVGELSALAQEDGVFFRQRDAATVKIWSLDERLSRAGLLDRTKGLPHARDAARHALYSAVWDAGLPDPLLTRT